MIEAHIGYAADAEGRGVAYARLQSKAGERLVRVAFRTKRYAGLCDREVSYAALTAVSALLQERSVERVAFVLADASLVSDVKEHRDVPAPLVIPYVRLGCALNRFAAHALRNGNEGDDLTQRARSEIALNVAA